MNYIVMDLEWNQAISQKFVKTKPVYLSGEIIEIGAVKVDEEFNIIDSYKQYVKPNFYKKMHWSVLKLTKITENDLKDGMEFYRAIDDFKSWCGEKPLFITWGPDDVPMFKNNLRMYDWDFSFLNSYCDAQQIFDKQIAHENRQISLSAAMEMLGEEELEAHDALHDALNTVAVCKHLDMATGMAEYKPPFVIDDLPRIESADFTFLTIDDMKKSKKLKKSICPHCGRPVEITEWISVGKDKKISAPVCRSGHRLFMRLKTRKFQDEKITVSLQVYDMTDDLQNYFDEKREKYMVKLEKYLAMRGKRTEEQTTENN